MTSASYPVPIVDDSTIEDTETFTASLNTTESIVNIGDDTATVTILDVDSKLFTIILVVCKKERQLLIILLVLFVLNNAFYSTCI